MTWSLPKSVALALLAGAALLGAGYATGEPKVAGWMCRAGLPNPSVPSRFRADLPGGRCRIFGESVRITGVWWWDGFESSGFFPGRFAEESLVRRGIDWPGIGLHLDEKSDPRNLLAPYRTGPLGGGRALVTLEGRLSLGRGAFGHLGAHDRVILVERIVSAEAAPGPSERDYRRWRRILDGRGRPGE